METKHFVSEALKKTLNSNRIKDVVIRRVLKWSAIALLFVLSIILLLLYKSISDSIISFINTFVLAITVSIFTTATIEFFTRLQEEYALISEQFKFRSIFDCSLNPEEEVAIVIPSFSINKQSKNSLILAENDTGEFIEYKKNVLEELFKSGSLYSASRYDIEAAYYIASSFAQLQFKIPKIIWDYQALAEYKNESSPIKTFIAIGLFSNSLTLKINDDSNSESLHRPFKLIRSREEYEGNGGGLIIENIIKLSDHDRRGRIKQKSYPVEFKTTYTFNGKSFKLNEGNKDRSIFAKAIYVTDEMRQTIIILGGVGQNDTKLLCNKFCSNWKDVVREDFLDQYQNVKDSINKNFAILYNNEKKVLKERIACPNKITPQGKRI